MASARRAFETAWQMVPGMRRRQLLGAFADLIEKHVDELALCESLEVGRPIRDARELISLAPDFVRRYASLIDRPAGELGTLEGNQMAVSWRRPRGVVVAIVPWNFPVFNALVRLAPALAAGNCVVLKPSDYAPRAAALLAALASEAGLPDGCVNVVMGRGATTGHRLAAHPDADLIAFTGSNASGLAVSRAAAGSSLKPLLLECGGKSPQIVLEDVADDPALWHGVFFSAFWNSGQWCAARTRLLVPRHLRNQAVDGLRAAAEAWAVGDPLADGTRLGPLINRTQFEKVQGFVDLARREGTVMDLGTAPDRSWPAGGLYMRPALALDQPRGGTVCSEEVFGPLLTVETFDGVDDALALANAGHYGLMASIWTNRQDAAHKLARGVRAGGITVYASGAAMTAPLPDLVTNWLEPQKGSGHGIDGGLPGLHAYSTAQAVAWFS